MKKNIITLVVVISITLLAINLGLKQNKIDFQSQIDSLNRANDSLLSQIDDNQKLINRIDSLNAVLENEIQNTKFKLGELNSKANIYKKLYNEEHNRIDTMSNPVLVREFTNAFD
jgi:peptidoglycan hydrolase CwlO-like protein